MTIKEKLFPEMDLLKVFEQKIETLSLDSMKDLNTTIKNIFHFVYQNLEHSRNIHQLIFEKKLNLLINQVGEKLESQRTELWKQKIEMIFSKVLCIEGLELKTLFPGVDEVEKNLGKNNETISFLDFW